MIPLYWYIDNQKNNVIKETYYFINQEVVQNFLNIIFILNSLIILMTIIAILYYAIKKRIKYEKVWGLV